MSALSRYLAFVLICFTLSVAQVFSSNADLLEMTVLDSGYADAIFIRSPEGENILLDSGDVKNPGLVADFLNAKKIKELELVIISHPHKNHFGALFRVLDEFKIKEIVWNGDPNQEEPFTELVRKIKSKNIPMRSIKAGKHLKVTSDLRFEVFHPGRKMTSNINGNALVLKMTHGEVSVLFTTDIVPEVQNHLIEKFGDKLFADAVQIPHHGGPISEEFIRFFEPDFFILSTGPSEWPIPREEDVARLKAEVFRTDKHGHLVFKSDGNKIWRFTDAAG